MAIEIVEDIVIVGAGIAGLTTSLGLHRLGIRSLILESSETLRAQGYALLLWTNAWKALDAIGVGNTLRINHNKLSRIVSTSNVSGLTIAELFLGGDTEVRCINRKVLIETLVSELYEGTIRYSSKVVSIQESGILKLIHLADGSVIKTKVLIGCDGVSSIVAKSIGIRKPSLDGRGSIRGYVKHKDPHGFGPTFLQFFGNGVRYGISPLDDHGVYWYFTYIPTSQDSGIAEDPNKMKQFVLSNLGNVADKIKAVVEQTQLTNILHSQLKFRNPFEFLWENFSKDNVCVAGDALHPMTPDIGQGGCSALEDGVILARVLAEALTGGSRENSEKVRIMVGLKKFVKERRWRSMKLISVAYVVGYVQQCSGIVLRYLRDKMFARFLAGVPLRMSTFDCGKLTDELQG